MKVKIFGNSIASAYLAARLAESANEVEWYTTGLPMQLRPVRVRPKTIALVRSQLQRQGMAATPFMSAPEFRSSRNFFIQRKVSEQKFFTGAGGRWVDANVLMRSLRKLVKDIGVEVHDVNFLDVPLVEENSDVLIVVDSSARQFAPPILSEDDAILASTRPERQNEYGLELWLPLGRTKNVTELSFFIAGHTQVILEPHPESGYTLTFIGSTMADVKRAYRVVEESEAPALVPLRALIHLNNQAYRQREFVRERGSFVFSRPGVLPIGAALGSYPAFSNLEDDEFVLQAERLISAMKKAKIGTSTSDKSVTKLMAPFLREWNNREVSIFKKNFNLMSVWGTLFSALPRSKLLQSAANLLPHRVRAFMRSPF